MLINIGQPVVTSLPSASVPELIQSMSETVFSRALWVLAGPADSGCAGVRHSEQRATLPGGHSADCTCAQGFQPHAAAGATQAVQLPVPEADRGPTVWICVAETRK